MMAIFSMTRPELSKKIVFSGDPFHYSWSIVHFLLEHPEKNKRR